MNQRLTLLALHLTAVVGPRRLKSIKSVFPSNLSDVFGITEDQLAELENWTPASAKKVLSFKDPQERAEQEIQRAESKGIDVLIEGDDSFPKVFENIYDPPFVLWKIGNYLPEDENAIAVIGCRRPSAYGKQAALKLGEDIAKAGYTVVSGLARGIDSIAHQGALKFSKGRTIAFLGSGLLNMYPPENKKLASEIASRGAVFSEYPLFSKPLAMHFPQRNRLISGSSKGVLVVEANKDSGSFITVDHAIDQGKPVFAVPGPIHQKQSEGAHALIQQGAKLVTGVEDIFHEIQDVHAQTIFKSRAVFVPLSEEKLSNEEKTILDHLAYTPVHIDILARMAGIQPRRLNELLLSLELQGFVHQAPGHCYFKV